jgi:hypothetical protein
VGPPLLTGESRHGQRVHSRLRSLDAVARTFSARPIAENAALSPPRGAS